jgi:hypothetical protein
MIRKICLMGGGLLVALMSVAIMASGASAAKAKPVLNLKKAGKVVANGTAVGGGWVGAIEIGEVEEPGENIYTYFGCETEGLMTLVTNGSTKADVAKGEVGVPTEECGEFEATEEVTAPKAAKLGRSLRRTRIHKARVHQSVSETITPITGVLTGEEMSVKKTAAIAMSVPLRFEEVTGALKCAYESKTKLKGEWPVEEFPETADIEAEFAYKLDKSLSVKKGCAKAPEGFIEAWVGPDFEELEAELT